MSLNGKIYFICDFIISYFYYLCIMCAYALIIGYLLLFIIFFFIETLVKILIVFTSYLVNAKRHCFHFAA